MERREFLENCMILGAGMTLSSINKCSQSKIVPKRKLGKTGEKLSMIGFGGIIVMDETIKTAKERVAKAVDRGINYFDVAPTYGNAETRLGPALKPYRKDSFLACKTTQRGKKGAREELENSLKNLQTDYFDLYQLHAITTEEDVKKAFGPDGAMEVFQKAKKDGLVRYLGFSAHSEKAALMAMERYDFDTLLFPLNYVCWHKGNFGKQVVAKAKEKNMGILALKALAYSRIPEGEKSQYEKLWYQPIEDNQVADYSLRFTLSQGTTAAIPPGDYRFFNPAIDIACNYSPLNQDEEDQLLKSQEDAIPLFTT
jgi:predicted aldo/keto reductase-like oxidoreductase